MDVVPVPEMNGLLIGVDTLASPTLPVNDGSRAKNGVFAVEKKTSAPVVPCA